MSYTLFPSILPIFKNEHRPFSFKNGSTIKLVYLQATSSEGPQLPREKSLNFLTLYHPGL